MLHFCLLVSVSEDFSLEKLEPSQSPPQFQRPTVPNPRKNVSGLSFQACAPGHPRSYRDHCHHPRARDAGRSVCAGRRHSPFQLGQHNHDARAFKLSTMSGNPLDEDEAFKDGEIISTHFNDPAHLTVDRTGNVVVADRRNHAFLAQLPRSAPSSAHWLSAGWKMITKTMVSRQVCVFYCHLKTYCGSSSEIMQSPE